MKHALSLTILALLLTLPLAPDTARADALRISVGPHVGWTQTVESEETAVAFGFATRLRLMESIAAELAIDYRKEDIDAGEIKTIPVQLSGLLYLMPVLHGTIGIGWYNVDASLEGVGTQLQNIDDTASDAGLHLGAGLDLEMSPRTSLTAEIRYVFLDYEIGEADAAIKQDADFYTISAGFQFYLW